MQSFQAGAHSEGSPNSETTDPETRTLREYRWGLLMADPGVPLSEPPYLLSLLHCPQGRGYRAKNKNKETKNPTQQQQKQASPQQERALSLLLQGKKLI